MIDTIAVKSKSPEPSTGGVARVSSNHSGYRALIFSLSLLLAVASGVAGQEYPDEIRGYKVHKAKIVVVNKEPSTQAPVDDKEKTEAFVRLTDPQLTDTSLTGLTFEISGNVDPLDYRGRVDFLTFKDFKVNGLSVDIDEYSSSFEFKKKEPISLPKPISIFLGTRQALRGAVGELRDSKPEWTVTGTVFVFGRFKKWGFNIKRVVPVEVNVKIKNPIRDVKILGGAVPSI